MLSSINWTRPWYASIQHTAEVINHDHWQASINELSAMRLLTNHRGLPLTFVDQTVLPEGIAYETFISITGSVPTRNNLHDFFNALVWLSFPLIKRQLNALQALQIETQGIGKSRGAARDAATLFDENATLLVVSDTAQGEALIDALRRHHWHNAFIDQRETFNEHAAVWLFGHALMEKLTTPYKAIIAHLWVVSASDHFFSMTHDAQREWLDVYVAEQLKQQGLNGFSTRCFTPLPVLGVPGWWQAQDREFYADATVFRPKKGGDQ